MKTDWRAKILRELWNIFDESIDDLTDEQADAIDAVIARTATDLCAIAGHEPTRDQCMIPEHDFCIWCHLPMPNAWQKPPEVTT